MQNPTYTNSNIFWVGRQPLGFYLNKLWGKIHREKRKNIVLSGRGINILKALDIADAVCNKGFVTEKPDQKTLSEVFVIKSIRYRAERMQKLNDGKKIMVRIHQLHITIGIPEQNELFDIDIIDPAPPQQQQKQQLKQEIV